MESQAVAILALVPLFITPDKDQRAAPQNLLHCVSCFFPMWFLIVAYLANVALHMSNKPTMLESSYFRRALVRNRIHVKATELQMSGREDDAQHPPLKLKVYSDLVQNMLRKWGILEDISH